MISRLIIITLSVAATISSASADHFYYGPSPAVVAPVVAYQPAYVVPTTSYSVMQFPVTTVSYSSGYYAPMVPVSGYYAPVAYRAPVYAAPVYSSPFYAVPRIQSVRSRLNIHRHGGYNYRVRVRNW